MRSEISLVCVLCSLVVCNATLLEEYEESRGKKKKIALFVYFADLVLKKFFILKLIYAFVFWCIIHKAGYFLSWFIHYLKEKKEEYHHPHDLDHHHHDHHPHFEYGHHYEYGPSQSYGSPAQYGNYGPYRRKTQGYQ